MTKKVRIENADTNYPKLVLIHQHPNDQGEWITATAPPPVVLHYPCDMAEIVVHKGQRIVIEEAAPQTAAIVHKSMLHPDSAGLPKDLAAGGEEPGLNAQQAEYMRWSAERISPQPDAKHMMVTDLMEAEFDRIDRLEPGMLDRDAVTTDLLPSTPVEKATPHPDSTLVLKPADLPPSYHDLHITTAKMERTSLANLPFMCMVTCTRAGGWELWREGGLHRELMACEFIGTDELRRGLRLDVNGHVIVDSLTKDPT